jgi:hypothetical protein
MMRISRFLAAFLLSLSAISPILAQSAERPPASFTGQQYVDSKGCIYLRAGYGGVVQWVPRISASRQPICGYPPTFGAANIEVAEEAPTTQPQATVAAQRVVVVQQPKTTVQAAPTNPVQVATAIVQPTTAAPSVVVPVTQTRVAQPVQVVATGPGPGKIGCYRSVPVPVVVQLQRGGTAIVCTKGDGTMDGWRPPIFPQGAPVGAALNFPKATGYEMATSGQGVPSTTATATAATPPPKGYKAAWDDDRLNPARAIGTAQGQAQQDKLWTREVPAQQVAATAKTAVSSNTNSTAATGSLYVQVGTFGVPSNAAGASAKLSSVGLPTAKGKFTKNGQALQIVFAGPFTNTAAAQAALSAARAAGFSDAFIR